MCVALRTMLRCQRVVCRVWTHLKWLMPVPDILKEMNLALVGEKSSCNRVNGSISPAFIVESSGLVEVVEILEIRF